MELPMTVGSWHADCCDEWSRDDESHGLQLPTNNHFFHLIINWKINWLFDEMSHAELDCKSCEKTKNGMVDCVDCE